MGGGQAGAPADDDHVPWSRPPGMATVTSPVTARAGPDPGTGSRNRSRPRPGSGPKGQQGGSGGRAGGGGGAEKICQEPHQLRCCD
jgi:hypothetical protein